MLITIDTNAPITQPDLAVLAQILRNADPTIDIDAVVPTEKPAPRKRRTKAEMEAARAAEAAPEEAPAEQTDQELTDALDAESAAAEATVTLEELKAVATKLLAEKGRSAVQELVDELGLKRLSDAPEDQYAEVVSAIRAKLDV